MKRVDFKIQLYFSLIMTFLIIILLTVIWLLNGMDITTYLFVVVSIFIWPTAIFVSFKQSNNSSIEYSAKHGKAPVKLSLIGWVILSSALVLYNYSIDGSLTWALYPISGITLWPIGMFLYNYLYTKIK